MRVLFVSSGNSEFGINPIVANQGKSLSKSGIEVDYFTIKGKGLIGYLKNIIRLKIYIGINKQYNIIHAHFSLSAIIASFICKTPIIVSLMGSDLYLPWYYLYLSKLLNKLRWSAVIVKSKQMKEKCKIHNSIIIPNGVDHEKFCLLNRRKYKELSSLKDKQIILFAADPKRKVKNFNLALESIKLISHDNIELKVVSGESNDLIPGYLNTADVLLLTSLHEGSPNIIKEAMSCNCPIVSTDVGDVRQVLGNTEGCYICSYEPADVALKISLALEFVQNIGRTNGRQRIIELCLDSESVAKRIIEVYHNVLKNNY